MPKTKKKRTTPKAPTKHIADPESVDLAPLCGSRTGGITIDAEGSNCEACHVHHDAATLLEDLSPAALVFVGCNTHPNRKATKPRVRERAIRLVLDVAEDFKVTDDARHSDDELRQAVLTIVLTTEDGLRRARHLVEQINAVRRLHRRSRARARKGR